MKIWFFSDTHSQHSEIDVPDCDIACFCGDESISMEKTENIHEAIAFFEWYNALDIKYKVFIPGNHSAAFYWGMIDKNNYPSITFLDNSGIEIEGLYVWGSPYTPSYGRTQHYMKDRNKLDAVWEHIPSNTNILLTHGPPLGIMDLSHDKENSELVQVGCSALYKRVMKINPNVHAFGHIHEYGRLRNNGILLRGNTAFVNCSVTTFGVENEKRVYKLLNSGYVLEV